MESHGFLVGSWGVLLDDCAPVLVSLAIELLCDAGRRYGSCSCTNFLADRSPCNGERHSLLLTAGKSNNTLAMNCMCP